MLETGDALVARSKLIENKKIWLAIFLDHLGA
jgi:hypothetical protein